MGTIAEKLTYLDETRENIRQSINSIGGSLTNSDTFRSYSDAIDEIYEKFPKVEGEGSNITLENTMEASIKSELNGDTSQDGTPTPTTPVAVNVVSGEQDILVCGKNLFNKDVFIQGTWQSSSPANRIVGFLIPTKAGQKYRFTLRNNELDFAIGNTTKNVQSGNTQVQSDSGWQTTDYTYTITGDGYLFLQVKKRYGGNITPSDLSATDFQVELGETGTTFEAYNGTTYGINLGKNILNVANESGTDSGITYSLTDNVLTYSGTASGSYFNIGSFQTCYLPAGTYTFSIDQATTNNERIVLYTQGTTNQNIIIQGGDKSITVVLNDIKTKWRIGISNLITNSQYSGTLKLQLEKGSQASSYSAYKTPIELCKIGDYKDRIFRNTGKNLCGAIEEGGYNTTTGVKMTGSFYRNAFPIEIKPNTSYIFSINGTGKALNVLEYDKNMNFIRCYNNGAVPAGTSFTTSSTTKYINIFRGNGDGSDKWQIEKGTTITPYEPYGTKGSWYIEKNIGKTVFTGGEGETWSYTSVAQGSLFRNNNVAVSMANIPPISNYFIGVSNTGGRYDGTIYYNPSVTSTKTTFDIIMNSITTAGDFKSWLSTHNTTVYYPLPTPTYTEITDSELVSQLGSFGEAQSYVGTTNINVDGILPAILNVKALENIFN